MTQYSDDVLTALARLRDAAANSDDISNVLARAFQKLDNAGVFADLDEQTDYASAEAILVESARNDLAKAHGPGLLVCTCDQPKVTSPALHAGTCPVWAVHHGLMDRYSFNTGTLGGSES